jgi:hypothetical protein
MGTFNTLIIATECQNCHRWFDQKIQFCFGKTWQYFYKPGDKVKRSNTVHDIGMLGLPRVKAYGSSEGSVCPFCKHQNPDEYNVIIENDVIKGIDSPVEMDKYTEENDYNYYVDEAL